MQGDVGGKSSAGADCRQGREMERRKLQSEASAVGESSPFSDLAWSRRVEVKN